MFWNLLGTLQGIGICWGETGDSERGIWRQHYTPSMGGLQRNHPIRSSAVLTEAQDTGDQGGLV